MTKKIIKNILFSLAVIFTVISASSCGDRQEVLCSVPAFYQDEPLKVKSRGLMTSYLFSSGQQEFIKEYFNKEGNGALLIELEVVKGNKKSQPYSDQFGFLYQNDLSSSGAVLSQLETRPLVFMDFNELAKTTCKVLFSFSKDKEIPAGFFIKTKGLYKILSARIEAALVGFDYRSQVPLYAFAPNGGSLIAGNKKIDFSGISMCFPSHNSDVGLMPQINICFNKSNKSNDSQNNVNQLSESSDVKLIAGGEKITVRDGGNDILTIPSAALKAPFSVFEISENPESVDAVFVSKSSKNLLECSQTFKRSVLKPYKVDPGLIISWPKENWRSNDYELFEWDRFAGILLFDIADYSVQDDFFRRLAFFVEKQGFKGQLLTDEEIAGKHGYNAHDYKAEDLARFFEEGRKKNFQFNKRELLLKEILAVNGIINVEEDGRITSGKGAVISISQESPSYLRTTFVSHEGWHGIFFVDEDFRNTSASIYYSLKATDPGALNFLFRYFQVTPTLNYDTEDDYLMKNEFMAYMLQRPLNTVEKYYTDMAGRQHSQYLIKSEADYILKTKASGFVGSAQMFDEYVFNRWNLNAGRVWLISR